MATTDIKITTEQGWVLVATAAKCTVQIKAGTALYQRATSLPADLTSAGIVRNVNQSITNSYDTPENSYIRAVGGDVSVCVITE